jgi:hypothetical protein
VTGDERSGGEHVSRRSALKRAGIVGAVVGSTWVAPEVMSLSTPAAAASGPPADVVSGTFVHAQGNSATFRSQDMPSGTFTKLVLFVAIVADNQGTTGPTAAQPITVATTGWSAVSTLVDGLPPGVGVFEAAPGAAPPVVASSNLQSGRVTAVLLGWTVGTVVTVSTIVPATSPATSITVPSTTAPTHATWVFAGSASDGSANNNWATLPPANWSPVVVPDVGGSSNTPPDLYVARNNAKTVSVGPVTETFYQTGSGGTSYGAKALFIGVS